MCTDFMSDWYEAPEALTVWKAVRRVDQEGRRVGVESYPYRFRSAWRPDQRYSQDGLSEGHDLEYVLGKTHVAPPSGFGFYCYLAFADARHLWDAAVLRCTVPAGTLVRETKGTHDERRGLNAQVLVPEEEERRRWL